ncbi:MAG: Crp/Fnr family transcriptional regulator [Bacteroidota bacterium]
MNHKEQIALFFETDYPLNKDGVEELIASFKLKEYPKNSLLLSENEFENKLRFINKGVVREFYRTEKKEININFYTRPQFITDFSSFIQDTKTNKNQEALSSIQILELGKDTFVKLLEKYSCGKSFIDLTFQNILKNKEVFEYNRMTKEPEALYNELRIYRPKWLQEIPQYHIASYLGITPETLSRIRKRLS